MNKIVYFLTTILIVVCYQSCGNMEATHLSNSTRNQSTESGKNIRFVGLRFITTIPQGAKIVKARLSLTNATENKNLGKITIRAQDDINAEDFSSGKEKISNRSVTNNRVDWVLSGADSAVTTEASQMTPDLSGLVQELVNRPDWLEGSPIVFILEGQADWSVLSFEGAEQIGQGFPKLQLEYEL